MTDSKSSAIKDLAALKSKVRSNDNDHEFRGDFVVPEEIRSNADVEGNLNSKFLYNQSKTENEGLSMPKVASYMGNKYLEKIASTSWVKNLGTSIKKADPLTQLGVGSSMLGLGLSGSKTFNDYRSSRNTSEASKLQERSLRALNSINKSLSTSVIHPSPVPVQRPDPKKGL